MPEQTTGRAPERMRKRPDEMTTTEGLLAIAAALRQVAEELASLRDTLPSYDMWGRLIENLRSDHPLQGETFGEIAGALDRIATALEDGKE